MQRKIVMRLCGLFLSLGSLAMGVTPQVMASSKPKPINWGYQVLEGWAATNPDTVQGRYYWGQNGWDIVPLNEPLPQTLLGMKGMDDPQLLYDVYLQEPQSVERMLGTGQHHFAVGISLSLLKIWQIEGFNPASVGGPNIPPGFYNSYAQKHLGILVVAHYDQIIKPGHDIPGLPKPPGDATAIQEWRWKAAHGELKMPKLPYSLIDFQPSPAQRKFAGGGN